MRFTILQDLCQKGVSGKHPSGDHPFFCIAYSDPSRNPPSSIPKPLNFSSMYSIYIVSTV